MKPNYKNACVYKLCCNDPKIKDIYVGSTCNFRVRKNQHKTKCTNPKDSDYNHYKYRFIREHGGFENWSMVLLDNVDCEDKQTLHKIERYYLEKLGATLNCSIPSRTIEEWREDNKEYTKKKSNEKYLKNMEKIKKQGKEKYKKNTKTILEKNAKWIKENRERYENNRNQTITCICESKIVKHTIARHKKTKKHRKLIAKIKKPLHIELLKLF
jgi:hypothetical protein